MQNIQSVRIFQYRKSVSRNISVPKNQTVRIFQYRIFSPQEYFGAKHSVSKDISVQNMQSVLIFQSKKISQ